MSEIKTSFIMSRRAALRRGATALTAIAVVVSGASRTFAAGKAEKDDFYFQEKPDVDSGRNCTGCINFTAKATGAYGKDSGDCALLIGDVCDHCYCQGWTDKNAPGAKKAGA